MSELKNFIELVESNNLLFELENDSFFDDDDKKFPFLTIANYVDNRYKKKEAKKLKYDLSSILDKNIADEEAIKVLSEYLKNEKIADDIINYKKELIVSLAEDLRDSYKACDLDELDDCLVFILSNNLLYENKLGVFFEVGTGKKYRYAGPSSKAFHNALDRPDAMIIMESEIFFNKEFVELYYNSFFGDADLTKHDFFNYKRFVEGKYKALPLWRLKLSLTTGFNLGNVYNFDSEFSEIYRFFIENNGYYFNIENIVSKVGKEVNQYYAK